MMRGVGPAPKLGVLLNLDILANFCLGSATGKAFRRMLVGNAVLGDGVDLVGNGVFQLEDARMGHVLFQIVLVQELPSVIDCVMYLGGGVEYGFVAEIKEQAAEGACLFERADVDGIALDMVFGSFRGWIRRRVGFGPCFGHQVVRENHLGVHRGLSANIVVSRRSVVGFMEPANFFCVNISGTEGAVAFQTRHSGLRGRSGQ